MPKKENVITEDKFVVDIDSFEDSGLSLNFLIADKFFDPSEIKDLKPLSIKELIKKVSDLEKDIDEEIDDFLLKKFVLPGTSLIEAVFRILILNNNKPMTVSEMEAKLKIAWASVIYLKSYTNETILEMLNSQNEYFIIKQD